MFGIDTRFQLICGYQGVRFLDEAWATVLFLFSLSISPVGQRFSHRAGTMSASPCGPKAEHGLCCAVNAYNFMIHGNLYHQFIAKCYHSLKCKFGEARC